VTEHQRWARVPPRVAWKRPGLPPQWVRVLERYPVGMATLPGWVWPDMPQKVRAVAARGQPGAEEAVAIPCQYAGTAGLCYRFKTKSTPTFHLILVNAYGRADEAQKVFSGRRGSGNE
jgi:hypothetical protein